MTTAEKHDFLADKSERKCVSYFKRKGSISLNSTFILLYYRFSRFTRWAAIPLLTFFTLSGCASTRETQSACPAPTSDGKQVKEDEDGKIILGGIMFEERPLWKRILWPFH
jgi:hypothetical protein